MEYDQGNNYYQPIGQTPPPSSSLSNNMVQLTFHHERYTEDRYANYLSANPESMTKSQKEKEEGSAQFLLAHGYSPQRWWFGKLYLMLALQEAFVCLFMYIAYSQTQFQQTLKEQVQILKFSIGACCIILSYVIAQLPY